MSPAGKNSDRWQEALDRLARLHDVPAAALGIAQGAEINHWAAGMRVPGGKITCQPEDIFRAGSIAKLMTTVGLMKCVDQNRLMLDDPIVRYLPELRTARPQWAKQITVAQLLSHSSGLDGDFFEDTGAGDDCLMLYVKACGRVDFLFEPGCGFSYCNAAFPIIARLTEVLTGRQWDEYIQEEVFNPLGMHSTSTLASTGDEVLSSYIRGPEQLNHWLRVDHTAPRSLAACGATPLSNADDLLRLGYLFLSGGRSMTGETVLSPTAVGSMMQEHCPGPTETFAHGWGLGTMRFQFSDQRILYGHDGAVDSFQCMLRVDPTSGTMFALMTNGGDARALYHDLADEVFSELTDCVPKPAPLPAAASGRKLNLHLDRYTGTYATASAVITVERNGESLVARSQPAGSETGLVPDYRVELLPVDRELFLAYPPNSRQPLLHRFLKLDAEDVPAIFHFRGRSHPRVT